MDVAGCGLCGDGSSGCRRSTSEAHYDERHAQRRARERAAVATTPAPGRALERWRPAAVEPITTTEIMALVAETPAALARRLEVERQQAAIQASILERPESEHLVDWGVTAVRDAAEVQVRRELRRDLVVGAG